jgi:hypothetical protein
MKIHRFFGKLLLIVTIPVVFVIVSSIVMSLLFAAIAVLAGSQSFAYYFKEALSCGAIEFLMGIVALIGTVLFLDTWRD